jgi:Major Facilitator Superfamily
MLLAAMAFQTFQAPCRQFRLKTLTCSAHSLSSTMLSRAMQTGHTSRLRRCLPSSPAASSYFVIAFTVLLGDTARGILWPTLYPLVTELGGSSLTLGGAVAAFSVGRVAGSPILGACSVRWGVAATLQWSLALFAVGAVMYALGEDSLPTIIAAQLVMGLGTSSLGVCRGYVADNSLASVRTQRLAQLTALQVLACILLLCVSCINVCFRHLIHYLHATVRCSLTTSPPPCTIAVCP